MTQAQNIEFAACFKQKPE